jgi:hypothetical protein
MERESFENVEIAEILNEHFVPVKVDREERPDVDRVYMNFVQVMQSVYKQIQWSLFFLKNDFQSEAYPTPASII